MRLPARTYFYCVVVAFLSGAGIFNVLSTPAEPAAPERPRRSVVRHAGPVTVENELTATKTALQARATSLLRARQYAKLDKLATEFRRSQASFANGYWKLTVFYQAVSDLETEASEAEWQTRMDLLRRWFAEDPDSITARVAMARGLVNYAWHARGDDWAAKVPKEAWQKVSARVTEAKRILNAAKLLPDKCPGWYSTWMFAAMLTKANRQEYDAMFAEAVKNFPAYSHFYFMKTWYLQERWYGRDGEWQTFARQSADRLGGEAGDILYAQIVWYVHDLRVYGNPISESGVEWARVQRGFEAIRRRDPDSLFALSEFCSLSGFAPTDARPLMRRLFAEVNNRVDLRVWQKMDLFVRDQQWAFSNN